MMTNRASQGEPINRRRAVVMLGWILALLPAGYLTGGLRLPKARASNSAARVHLSLEYINAGQPERAKDVLSDLLAAEPRNASAWNNLCVARMLVRELKDAKDACARALSIEPGYELAKNNLRWAEDEIRSERDALSKMQEMHGARDGKYFIAQGMHLLAIGDYDEAIEAWRRALTAEPRNAMAANNIGVAYMFRKEPAAAASWFRKAMAWDMNMSLARNNLLWAERERVKLVH